MLGYFWLAGRRPYVTRISGRSRGCQVSLRARANPGVAPAPCHPVTVTDVSGSKWRASAIPGRFIAEGGEPEVESGMADHGWRRQNTPLVAGMLPPEGGSGRVGLATNHRAKYPHGPQDRQRGLLASPLAHNTLRAVAYEQTGQRTPTQKIRSAR